MWQNFRDLGYRRLIYVNTVSVLLEAEVTAAVGGAGRVTGILLTAEDESVRQRLGLREVGSALELHMQRSCDRALELDLRSPEWVHRVSTDAKSTTRIAREILDIVAWTAERAT